MNDVSRRPGATEALRVLQGPSQAGDAPLLAEPDRGVRGTALDDAPPVTGQGSGKAEPEAAGPEAQRPEVPSEAIPEALPEAPSQASSEASAGAPRERSPQADVAAPAAPAAARATPRARPGLNLDAAWAALPVLALDARHLQRNLVVTARRTDPAHGAFDVLRTRVLGEMERRGWRRLGVTSPTKGCGKTFTAVNLAVTLSRLAEVRTLLLDLDLRQPAVARVLGATRPGAIGDFLRGLVPPEAALARVGRNDLQVGYLALGVNGRPEPFAAELFRHARMGEALRAAEARLGPDVTIFDLPPALAQDDVLALRPHYDALLLVAGGGQTTPRELKEAARRLGPNAPILGVVLNKGEGEGVDDYAYDYD